MTKTEAIELFGGKQADLASALNISSGAISQWPYNLPQRTADEVIGAAVRLGLYQAAAAAEKDAAA